MMEMPNDPVSLTIFGVMAGIAIWVIYREWRLQKKEELADKQSERRERKAKGHEDDFPEQFAPKQFPSDDEIEKYVYRKVPGFIGSRFEIGECDSPRSFPEMWCDRRICEGFWGDEGMARKVTAALNAAA